MADQILYSRIEGEGEDIIIIHGFLGMSDNWKSIGKALAGSGYRVHMLDVRNHGRSFHSDDFTYEAMVADVVNYMDHHELSEAYVLGHSMGGKIAMLLACQHPDRIRKLIVADIAPKPYRAHHAEILDALQTVDFESMTGRDEIREHMMSKLADAGVVEFLLKSLHWETSDKLAFRFNVPVLAASNEAIGQELPKDCSFDRPTLFLKGANSDYIKDKDQERIKTQFPKSVLVSLKDAGHWLHAEQPEAFTESTKAFLEK